MWVIITDPNTEQRFNLIPMINNPQISAWRAKIKQARCEHQHSLNNQLKQLTKAGSSKASSNNKAKPSETKKEDFQTNIERFEKKLEGSVLRVTTMIESTPKVVFPQQLPISQRSDEIADAIKNNQVVILAGETGSGKTTQLPKICLSLGYGNKGLIGHTQPRRIAARTVADRIASELKTSLGDAVGYQVRFKDQSSANTRIKLMTDGVLLAEFQRDRFLSRYEVIIIDEAHERSLNIDFLLGLLKPLCKRRPDLKIIITSATIDLEKFAQHFKTNEKPAPIIEVSGRTYPVQTIYQPPADDGPDLPDLITNTVEQVIRNEAKGHYKASGDILIFCAGEREIRDAALALQRAQLPIIVLPLYSRLGVAEQNKVFQPAHRRKVVLATNVAETSITVPGIAYVIDPGVARISRYSFRSKVQRLPIEAISQASANQRMGRCGRVANGVCIRLYSEEDFNGRATFTPAEILRSNLASVILKMLRLGVDDITKFDFLDKPDSRLINDGYKLLQELNAVDTERRISAIGKQMSDLPVDPRYARILVSAQQLGCLQDALVLISALSIQDPRERPADKQQAADQAHRELAHGQSDFYSFLHLWQAINDQRDTLSNSKFKQLCLERYWSIARVFEWRELYHQLAGMCKDLGWKSEPWQAIKLPEFTNKSSNNKNKEKQVNDKKNQKTSFDKRYEQIHKALLSGLISNIATKDVDDAYTATRSRSIHLFPGSPQAKRKPKWLICADLMETSRLFAHTIAQINPIWIIESANHLCKYNYSGPHYHAHSGAIKAQRKTLLYGLVLRDKESVNYGPINPTEAHQIFIQQALVDALYKPSKKDSFFDHNQRLIRDIEKLETKTRRRNLLISEQTLHEFYAERIPAQINNRNSFERWLWKTTAPKGKDLSNKGVSGNNTLLCLNREQLLLNEVEDNANAQFPDHIEVHGKRVDIIYKFNPGQAQDGVTMVVPISVLSPFPAHIGDWLVPGLLHEKCIALIKTLPKQTRRNFAPAADAVDRVYNSLSPANVALHKSLATQLFRTRGIKVDSNQFDLSKLDNYYLMNYRVIDVDGSLIDEERDLSLLKQRYADSVQKSIHADNAPQRNKLEQHNISQWDFGSIDASVEYQHQGMTLTAYPTLTELGKGEFALLLTDRASVANHQTHHGILALAQKTLSESSQRQGYKYLLKELMANAQPKNTKKPNNKGSMGQKIGLNSLAAQLKNVSVKQSDRGAWVNEIMLAGLRQSCFADGLEQIRDSESFHQAIERGSKHWVSSSMDIEQSLCTALNLRDELLAKIDQTPASTIAIDATLEDSKAQLYRLFEPGFLRYTSTAQLNQYPRYMRAIESRLEKLKFASKTVKEELMLTKIQDKFNDKISKLSISEVSHSIGFVYYNYPSLRQYALLLEEWRVSLFAQHLKTIMPVSEKRLNKMWSDITEELAS